MNILQWSKCEASYGRRLVDSALEGAREGEGKFLNGQPLGHCLEKSVLDAMVPTILGACLGWFGGNLDRARPSRKPLVAALLGGAIGFGASVIWENRQLTATMASRAWQNINKTRDAHWFEKNPINYA